MGRTLDWLVVQGYSLGDLESLTPSQLRLHVTVANERIRAQNAANSAAMARRRRY